MWMESSTNTCASKWEIGGLPPKPVFSELLECLDCDSEATWRWRQSARWIKYEELVEAGSCRWSQPHVATLRLRSYQQFTHLLTDSICLLNLHANTFDEIIETTTEKVGEKFGSESAEIVQKMLLGSKAHQESDSLFTSLARFRICQSKTTNTTDQNLSGKLPKNCEGCSILIGDNSRLKHNISVFIRLEQAIELPQLIQAEILTRIIFIVIGVSGHSHQIRDIGRAFGTFMTNQAHLLPPYWDCDLRISPKLIAANVSRTGNEPITNYNDPTLERTGSLFGGLRNDFYRKWPYFKSDFEDGLNFQSISSFFFMYFAILAPVGVIENLLSAAFCGVTYHLLAGQPLTVMGSTVLVFEAFFCQICQHLNLEYLTFRFWITTWISIILILVVAFDGSHIIRYFTRFTEELFAAFTSIIFITRTIRKLIEIYAQSDVKNLNTLFMSMILTFGTLVLILLLREFRHSPYFAFKVRSFISDFAVTWAIVLMVVIEHYSNIDTPKLDLPDTITPTNANRREWMIRPFGNGVWTCALAVLPAVPLAILLFIDQQITAIIVNRPENKLKKGHGYHLDLFVVALQVFVCGLFGLPLFVAATVRSMNHVNSLQIENEVQIPGETAFVIGIREQRLSGVLTFVCIGLSVYLRAWLQLLPMPVLYGVYLYMGIGTLQDLQLSTRLKLLLMPSKYLPDLLYLRHVALRRVHLFTLIQLICLVSICTLKMVNEVAITFPMMLIVIVTVRRFLGVIFTPAELKHLDDEIPEPVKREKLSEIETNNYLLEGVTLE